MQISKTDYVDLLLRLKNLCTAMGEVIKKVNVDNYKEVDEAMTRLRDIVVLVDSFDHTNKHNENSKH